MTKVTRDQIVCTCGHAGYLVHIKNDVQFGSWTRYELEGFHGFAVATEDPQQMPKHLFTHAAPSSTDS